jgi:hypothetical protein
MKPHTSQTNHIATVMKRGSLIRGKFYYTTDCQYMEKKVEAMSLTDGVF